MKDIAASQLLQLVFLRIAMDHKPNNAWFTLDDAILHPAIFKLQQKYGQALPPLEKLHFVTAGAFPYSHELSDCIDNLKAGYFTTLITTGRKDFFYCRILGEDSDLFLAEGVKGIFQNDVQAKESFHKLVHELWENIKRCPYPIT